MRELDAWNGTMLFDEAHDPRQRLHVCVIPQAEVAGSDAPFARDRGGFCEHQCGATHRACPEMNKVPVIRQTFEARVLAHRRHRDAAAQRDPANADWREQVGLRRRLRHAMFNGSDAHAVLKLVEAFRNGGDGYNNSEPPSRCSTDPVANGFVIRNRIACPTSSGFPTRRAGRVAVAFAYIA